MRSLVLLLSASPKYSRGSIILHPLYFKAISVTLISYKSVRFSLQSIKRLKNVDPPVFISINIQFHSFLTVVIKHVLKDAPNPYTGKPAAENGCRPRLCQKDYGKGAGMERRLWPLGSIPQLPHCCNKACFKRCSWYKRKFSCSCIFLFSAPSSNICMYFTRLLLFFINISNSNLFLYKKYITKAWRFLYCCSFA